MEVVICLASVALCAILKALNRFYIIKTRRIKHEAIKESQLMTDTVSYREYKRVSQKASVQNSCTRKEGDFWDYIMPYVKEVQSDCIENRLFSADGGEFGL